MKYFLQRRSKQEFIQVLEPIVLLSSSNPAWLYTGGVPSRLYHVLARDYILIRGDELKKKKKRGDNVCHRKPTFTGRVQKRPMWISAVTRGIV